MGNCKINLKQIPLFGVKIVISTDLFFSFITIISILILRTFPQPILEFGFYIKNSNAVMFWIFFGGS